MGRAAMPLIPYPRSRIRPVRARVQNLHRLRLYWQLWCSFRWQRAHRIPAHLLMDIEYVADECQSLSEAQLKARYQQQKAKASADFLVEDSELLGVLVALIERRTGFRLRHNQIETALSLLTGVVVELRTGEGKTLAAQLAALAAASVSVSVHVITVNDYLAHRDFEQCQMLTDGVGLSVGLVCADDSDEQRRQAYDSDIVYLNNKTLVFDALRDQADARKKKRAFSPRLMGQVFAIVDEADSVLIDDATVPMILSEVGSPPPPVDQALFEALFAFARGLALPRHASQDAQGWWRLNDQGRRELASALSALKDVIDWDEHLVRLAENALFALHELHERVHYVIQDEAVVLIDRSTGRLVPDRKWSYGLQQLVELKSGVPLTGETQQIEQMTQQRFFRRYHRLAGLTGTARECRAELWAIYGLAVHIVAPHRAPQMTCTGQSVFATNQAKWRAIADRAAELSATRSVLIGVNDVESSQALQAVCRDRGLTVHILDALSEAMEASLIEKAGEPGRITIATHLAGRGTDIPVSAEVLAAGGLHVIIASVMGSSRLERQLSGRTGRQGAPGSYEWMISLEDRQWREGLILGWQWLRAAGFSLGVPAMRLKSFVQSARQQTEQKRRISALLREQRMAQQLGYDRG